MDAADVQYQGFCCSVVDNNPKVVVAGEVEAHVVAVQVLVAACAGGVGQIEADVHLHAEGIVGADAVYGAAGGIVLCVVHIVGQVIGLAVGVIGCHLFCVGVCVGGVQRQEVRLACGQVCGGCFQIVIDIEAACALIVRRSIQLGVVVVITVVGVGGIVHNLEQVVRCAQIDSAGNGFSCGEQCIVNGIAGKACCDDAVAGVLVFTGEFRILTVIGIFQHTACAVVQEDEVQGIAVFILHLTALLDFPCFRVRRGGDASCCVRR